MDMANLNAKEYQRFEDIKHTTDEGMEFWYAREPVSYTHLTLPTTPYV